MKMSLVIPVSAALMALTFAHIASACTVVTNIEFTFYGSPDNDPPGDATAYSCGSRGYHAGGTGTYSNPVTFASAPGEFNQCEIIYCPFLQKYVRMDDTCAQCTTDYHNGKKHIDIWIGTSANGGQNEINCENSLTPNAKQSCIRNPSTSLKVNTAALFSGGKCNTGATYPNSNASC